MSKPIDQAQDILMEKGSSIMQADLDDMRVASLGIPMDEWIDWMMLMEGVALIVNDPSYSGDIKPFD